MRLAGLDAVLVDLDGTLVDTLGDFVDALDLMLADLGLPPVEPGLVARLIGRGAHRRRRRTKRPVVLSPGIRLPSVQLRPPERRVAGERPQLRARLQPGHQRALLAHGGQPAPADT